VVWRRRSATCGWTPAKALIATKDLDLARSVLTPLASSPHGGGEVEAAQAMLKAIDDREAAGDKAGR
jgi:hypothetical protein